MGVSENRGTSFWGPYNKDPTILGSMFGSPIFGNSHMRESYPAIFCLLRPFGALSNPSPKPDGPKIRGYFYSMCTTLRTLRKVTV